MSNNTFALFCSTDNALSKACPPPINTSLFLTDIPVDHTVFVDGKFGDDSTGQRESLSKPFQTITAGLLAAQAGDTVWVWPDTYNETLFLHDNVNVHLTTGTTITENVATSATNGVIQQSLVNPSTKSVISGNGIITAIFFVIIVGSGWTVDINLQTSTGEIQSNTGGTLNLSTVEDINCNVLTVGGGTFNGLFLGSLLGSLTQGGNGISKLECTNISGNVSIGSGSAQIRCKDVILVPAGPNFTINEGIVDFTCDQIIGPATSFPLPYGIINVSSANVSDNISLKVQKLVNIASFQIGGCFGQVLLNIEDFSLVDNIDPGVFYSLSVTFGAGPQGRLKVISKIVSTPTGGIGNNRIRLSDISNAGNITWEVSDTISGPWVEVTTMEGDCIIRATNIIVTGTPASRFFTQGPLFPSGSTGSIDIHCQQFSVDMIDWNGGIIDGLWRLHADDFMRSLSVGVTGLATSPTGKVSLSGRSFQLVGFVVPLPLLNDGTFELIFDEIRVIGSPIQVCNGEGICTIKSFFTNTNIFIQADTTTGAGNGRIIVETGYHSLDASNLAFNNIRILPNVTLTQGLIVIQNSTLKTTADVANIQFDVAPTPVRFALFKNLAYIKPLGVETIIGDSAGVAPHFFFQGENVGTVARSATIIAQSTGVFTVNAAFVALP